MTDLTIGIPWISITVFLPVIGAVLLAMVPGEHKTLHRIGAMSFMTLTFLVSLPLMIGLDPTVGGYQLTTSMEDISWIPMLGARYHVGIDGISMWLIMMTTFLGPIVVLASWNAIRERVKEFHIALLVLQTAMIGAFVALDLLLFYVFWELMLIPMYLLIGVWGGKRRIYAALKLFIYTMFGSMFMLVGILFLYSKGGAQSFSLELLTEVARTLTFKEQCWLFAGFAIAFLIKVPLFPFHTWLPDAHVEAPTAGSVILASILLKMGTYGLIRFAMPMMPDAVFFFAPYIAVLSVVGIVYGAVIAYVQKDIKKLVAYSSVSHLGFVTLGLFAMTEAAVMGALFQNLAHGIATGGLFLGIGMIYERRHTRELSEFGGLAKQVPIFATMFLIICFASAGVPGLVGFPGEFLILTGSAQSYTLSFGPEASYYGSMTFGPEMQAFAFVAVAASGVILGALYILWMVQKMLFGPLTNEKNKKLKDLSGREIAVMLPIVVLCFVMGLKPQLFIGKMEASVSNFIVYVEHGAQEYAADVEENERRHLDYKRWLITEGADTPWSIQLEHRAPYGDAAEPSTSEPNRE